MVLFYFFKTWNADQKTDIIKESEQRSPQHTPAMSNTDYTDF